MASFAFCTDMREIALGALLAAGGGVVEAADGLAMAVRLLELDDLGQLELLLSAFPGSIFPAMAGGSAFAVVASAFAVQRFSCGRWQLVAASLALA